MSTDSHDSTAAAIALMILAVLAGVGLDAVGKWLLDDYALAQFIFLRSVFGALAVLVITVFTVGLPALRTRRPGWHLLRTVISTGTLFGFFYGVANVPLVDVITIAFAAPLVLTALSAPLLNEHVGWRRWVAVIAGFIGVMITMRPGAGIFHPASFAVLGSAVLFAITNITTRKLTKTETSQALSFYILFGPMLLSSPIAADNWRPPLAFDWVLFAIAGTLAALAWLALTAAFRRAPPVILVPFEYTAIIWSAAAGYFVWNEVPTSATWIGAAIIAASGLYIFVRETRVTGEAKVSTFPVQDVSAVKVEEEQAPS
jgi:drug/metabolite transporter (DMT)-like permease